MENLLVPLLALVFGLIGLIWGADRFVTGSAGAARGFGISPLIIGLTIVSIGTSAPEVIVAIDASLKEAGDLAVGNALGSNLANIGLVLGITALVSPLPIQKHLLTHEAPILLFITLMVGYFLGDGRLTFGEGMLLLGALIPVLWLTIALKLRHPPPEEMEAAEEIPSMPLVAAFLWLSLGLGALLISSDILVWGATQVAQQMGVSPLIIGLTIIAVGTSLPELAASVMSALRGHHDIALGNIFGSNLFNMMGVMSVPGLINPPSMGSGVFYRDYLSMLLITILLVAWIGWALYRQKRRGLAPRVSRPAGVVLLLAYLGYISWLTFSS